MLDSPPSDARLRELDAMTPSVGAPDAHDAARLLEPDIARFAARTARLNELLGALDPADTAARLQGFRELIALRDLLSEAHTAAVRCVAAERLEFRSLPVELGSRLRAALAERTLGARAILALGVRIAGAVAADGRRDAAERSFGARLAADKPTAHVPSMMEHRELLGRLAPELIALVGLLE